MSGKLDQSLDEIMKDRKPTGRRGRGRLPNRTAATKAKLATAAVVAPAGGVKKNTKGTKNAKVTAAVPVATKATGDSKISVSGLPEDVTERLIKDYFTSTVAPVKKVTLNYAPNGRSRGSAVVVFAKPTAAADAAKSCDGTFVDGRPMRVEVLVGAQNVTQAAPPKSLQERTTKPKSAAQTKAKGVAGSKAPANGTNKGASGKKRSGRGGRPKPKTTEELDAEMQDYFGGATQPAAAAAAATNGVDTGMVDEVM